MSCLVIGFRIADGLGICSLFCEVVLELGACKYATCSKERAANRVLQRPEFNLRDSREWKQRKRENNKTCIYRQYTFATETEMDIKDTSPIISTGSANRRNSTFQIVSLANCSSILLGVDLTYVG